MGMMLVRHRLEREAARVKDAEDEITEFTAPVEELPVEEPEEEKKPERKNKK